MGEDSVHESWDALFGSTDVGTPGRAPRSQSTSNPVQPYLELPGVKGALRVALDGTILGKAGELDAEQDAALAVFLGAAGGQLGQMLNLGALQYSTVAFGNANQPMLLLRQPDVFLALILDSGISPTHVISKLQDLRGRR